MALRQNQSDLHTQTPVSSDLTPFAPRATPDDTGRLGLLLVVFGAIALLGAIAALAIRR